jgi:hypothetical protein
VYQPYVPYPSSSGPDVPPPVPSTVQRAVLAMYVGAGSSLVGIVVSALMLNSIKRQILDRVKRPANMKVQDYVNLQHTLSNVIGTVGLAAIVLSGLVGAGLWLWMAVMCKQGRSWARVVSTVFFAISCLGLLFALTNLSGGGLWNLVTWVIGLVAIILLWQRPSSDFFSASTGPRY